MDSVPPEYGSRLVIGPCQYCGGPVGASATGIGEESPPQDLMRALAWVRAAAAFANAECGALPPASAAALSDAALELAQAPRLGWDRTIWQDGAGAGVAYPLDTSILLLARRHAPVTADDVRRHQCADAFLAAAHVAALRLWRRRLSPALAGMVDLLEDRARAWTGLIKIGRTHLQDAAPLTLGQEVSGYAEQTRRAGERIEAAATGLEAVPFGRGCLGVGAALPAAFAPLSIRRLGELAGLRLSPSPHPLAEQSGLGGLVFMHAALAAAAAAFFKIASDVTLLASGPQAGFNELRLPETGLTCSSLPGKTNPDAAEALAQVCVQIIGADSAVAFAGSQGQFELNGFAPLAAFNVLRSLTLLADALEAFARFGLAGLEPRTDILARNVTRSVMLVTALAPLIGYDAAAKIARAAYQNGLDLRDAALASGLVDEETYDRLVRPERMLGPNGG